jgi:hypothetical protein
VNGTQWVARATTVGLIQQTGDSSLSHILSRAVNSESPNAEAGHVVAASSTHPQRVLHSFPMCRGLSFTYKPVCPLPLHRCCGNEKQTTFVVCSGRWLAMGEASVHAVEFPNVTSFFYTLHSALLEFNARLGRLPVDYGNPKSSSYHSDAASESPPPSSLGSYQCSCCRPCRKFDEEPASLYEAPGVLRLQPPSLLTATAISMSIRSCPTPY